MAEDLDQVWNAYREVRLDQALAGTDRLLQAHPDDGEIWYARACILERAGQFLEADRAFRTAAEAPENPCEPPYRISWDRFRNLIAEAKAALPSRLRQALDEVTLILEDHAAPGLLNAEDGPELLGLFSGPARQDLASDPGGMTPCIHLWRRSHEHACRDLDEMRQELRITLWHELGHYLGFEEEDLRPLEADEDP